MSIPTSFIHKRVVKKACQTYFNLKPRTIIEALANFIQNYTPSDKKYLTNPHKNLLLALTGSDHVSRPELIQTINEIQEGPLSNEWLEVLPKVYDKPSIVHDISVTFQTRPVAFEKSEKIQSEPLDLDSLNITLPDKSLDIEQELLALVSVNITLPEKSLDIQEEIKNLKETIHEINESIKEQSMIQEIKQPTTIKQPLATSTMLKPLDLRKKRPKEDLSFLEGTLEEPDFKDVLHSTIDQSQENAINVFWKVRDGNLEKLQKVTVPKLPPKDKYPIKHHFLHPEPLVRPIKQPNMNLDKLQSMIDELGVYKTVFDHKIKEHKFPHKARIRHPLIGINRWN